MLFRAVTGSTRVGIVQWDQRLMAVRCFLGIVAHPCVGSMLKGDRSAMAFSRLRPAGADMMSLRVFRLVTRVAASLDRQESRAELAGPQTLMGFLCPQKVVGRFGALFSFT